LKKINLLVLTLCLAVIAAVAVIALMVGQRPDTLPEALTAQDGYVYISAGNEGKWFALPEAETPLTLRRTKADGTVVENIVALTPQGAFMQSSTCDNQDCVHQGVVTLENKSQRVLQNMILCLPNEVVIELYSAQELEAFQNAQP